MKKGNKNKSFLKKADTTEFDQYNCGTCSKFGTRHCPFIGTASEPTEDTRACMHFDKSYTVEVENTDYKEVSTITQSENLYKHYEKPTNLEVEKDENEPFSKACGQCSKFGTIMCPYLENNSSSRACQSFSLKTPEGEDEVKMQNFDYDALVHDIPRENYHIHPKTNTRKDMVEHPFEFKTIYPQPFRVANKNNRFSAVFSQTVTPLNNQELEGLKAFQRGAGSLKNSGLVNFINSQVEIEHFLHSGEVFVEAAFKKDPNLLVFYKFKKDNPTKRILSVYNDENEEWIESHEINHGVDPAVLLRNIASMLKVASKKKLQEE